MRLRLLQIDCWQNVVVWQEKKLNIFNVCSVKLNLLAIVRLVLFAALKGHIKY